MEASELKEILDQHQLWISTKGKQGERANLTDADLMGADLMGADLTDADLTGADLRDAILYDANLTDANLSGAILRGASLSGAILPDISWIIPGCLAQLNEIKHGFFLAKESKWENFVQDSIGFFIQYNLEEKTFDILLGDRIIRNIPDWIKYSGLNQAE
jgi:uncharacterized protein YjbI with pentapeptide repeats